MLEKFNMVAATGWMMMGIASTGIGLESGLLL